MAEFKALVLRGSVLRVLELVAHIGVAFYMMPFVIHAIGDRYYGLWTLVGTFMGYYGFLDLGLSVATQRYMAGAIERNDQNDLNKLFTSSLSVLLFIAAIAVVITLLIANFAPVFFTDEREIGIFKTVLYILAANISVTLSMAPINGLITGVIRYDIVTGIQLIKLALRTGLVIYFIGSGYGIVALAVITLLTDIGANAVRTLIVLKMFPSIRFKREYQSKEHKLVLFSYGWRIFVKQISDLMRFQLDHMVIAAFINLSAVTLYNIAGQLVYYFRELLSQINGVLVPVYARYQAANNTEALYKAHYFVSKLAAAISVFVTGAAIIFGKGFIILWMGEDYVDAYRLVVLLIIPAMFYVSQSPAQVMVYGLGAVGVMAKASLIEASCNLVLSLILVKPLGLLGVALGTGIPMIFYALFLVVFSGRLVGGSVAVYLKSVTPVFLVGAGLQIASWFIVQGADLSGYLKLGYWLLLLYPPQALIMFFLCFPRDERTLIMRTCRNAVGLN